jgi:hypothetical protein
LRMMVHVRHIILVGASKPIVDQVIIRQAF